MDHYLAAAFELVLSRLCRMPFLSRSGSYVKSMSMPVRKSWINKLTKRLPIGPSIYLDDCGPRIADQPKLERMIGRLNDYWGGKVLSQVSAAECRGVRKEPRQNRWRPR